MPERAQESRTAEQELDWYLHGLPAAPNLKQWMLGWLQRHQPPRMTQEQVEHIFAEYGYVGDTGQPVPAIHQIITKLCVLALPPRPMLSREPIARILMDFWNQVVKSREGYAPHPQMDTVINQLMALVLPPSPTVTMPSREALEKIWDEEYIKVQAIICTDQRTYYMEPVNRQELGDLHRKWRRHIADRLMAWATGAGEAPCKHEEAVKWNSLNKVVQCHRCGTQFQPMTDAPRPEAQ